MLPHKARSHPIWLSSQFVYKCKILNRSSEHINGQQWHFIHICRHRNVQAYELHQAVIARATSGMVFSFRSSFAVPLPSLPTPYHVFASSLWLSGAWRLEEADFAYVVSGVFRIFPVMLVVSGVSPIFPVLLVISGVSPIFPVMLVVSGVFPISPVMLVVSGVSPISPCDASCQWRVSNISRDASCQWRVSNISLWC
jgi:hypothetical protein